MAETHNLHIPTKNGIPVFDVCLLRNFLYVDVEFNDNEYQAIDVAGKPLVEQYGLKRNWRIKVKDAHTAVYQYFLILKDSAKKRYLEGEYERLEKLEDKLQIFKLGGNIFLDEELITKNNTWILAAGPFNSADDARQNCHLFGSLKHCNIHRRLISKGSGTIEIFDTENEFFTELNDGLQLIPSDNSARFSLLNIELPMCGDYERSYKENLSYQGSLILEIDENSAISGINRIPVETYLKGILNSEVEETTRLEFAKAMAVTARSQIFASYGKKHVNEKFDFCCTSHCLRYYGKKNDNPIHERAVKETEGLILHNGKVICDGNYSFCCGGHTENNNILTDAEISHFSTGKIDGPKRLNTQLFEEMDASEWIRSQPDVYCSPDKESNKIAPAIANDSFRWEVFCTRNELEEIIRQKTGDDPGIIYEIIPLKRGVSGRVLELEILGSLKNFKISGEMNIRSALSKTMLNSSCFIVNSELDDDSVPLSFTFVGAGTGHGVGLCKAGALTQDAIGKSYEQILQHYFDKCTLKKLY